MATQKPISTISYNSEAFLKEKLDGWIKAHTIQAYQYIKHKGEDGDKDHIHVRLEPNKKLDPMDLLEELKEYPIGCKKPLACRPFRPSKEEDWYLYVVHDEEYLKLKYGGGEKGEKLPYDWHDIVASEDYDTEIAFIRAKAYLKHSTTNMAKRITQGEDPISLIMQGENVYTVNAIMRSLAHYDYQRLAKEYEKLLQQYDDLIDKIISLGYAIGTDQDGKITLEKLTDPDDV